MGNKQHDDKKVKIGILIDTEDVEAWIYETIRKICDFKYGTIALIIKNKPGKSTPGIRWGFNKKFSTLFYNFYLFLDRKIYSSTLDAYTKVSVSKITEDIPRIEIEPIHEYDADRISLEDIATIQSYDLDVIIKFGFNRLKGDILTHASTYGVWGFENCDLSNSERISQSFRDVMERKGATVTELKMFIDDRNDLVLYRSYSMTNHTSVNRNNNGTVWKSITFLPRVLRDLATFGDSQFFKQVKETNTPILKPISYDPFVPTNFRVINAILTFWFFKVIQKIKKLFWIEQWIVLFDFHPPGFSFPLDQFRNLRPPKDRFWADPHVVFHNDQYYVFIEELIYRNLRAHLSVITIDNDGNFNAPYIVLQKPYHLSYPFVFKYGQEYYMIPETSEHRTIELYRCAKFPDKWEFVMNLMENVEAVDATLLFKDNLWWMFVNMREHPGASFSDELFLFSSDNFLSTSWKPHPNNPIVSDVRHARPAGKIFEINGTLYRPGQDCSIRYGRAIQIHQILRLNELEYEERIVQTIEPNWQKHLLGTHTLNNEAGITVTDAEIYTKKIY
jgi:hypothetical protein